MSTVGKHPLRRILGNQCDAVFFVNIHIRFSHCTTKYAILFSRTLPQASGGDSVNFLILLIHTPVDKRTEDKMQKKQCSATPGEPAPRPKKSWKKRLLIFTALLACAAFIGGVWEENHSNQADNALGLKNLQPDWSCLKTNGSIKTYDDTKNNITGELGVDVSVHQGTVDWSKLKSQGVKFAMVRLGFRGYKTGDLVLDKNFKKNVEGARNAGMNVGVYFFSQAINETEAKEEAAYVLKNIKDLRIDYPVVFDQEAYTAAKTRTDDLTGKQATANCVAFCEAIRTGGYLPMVYMNSDWAAQMYDIKTLKSYLVWYADYRDAPTLDNGFAMWQYTAKGKLSGVGSTYIDIDLLFLPKN